MFWIIWWLSFTVFYIWPVHTFKGWDIKHPSNQYIQKLGLGLLILKTLFVNSLFSVIVPQVLFTYVLIDWVLPKYFYKKSNPFVVAGVFISILSICFLVAPAFKMMNPVVDYSLGLIKSLPTWNTPIQGTMRDQITTLPIVVGFAVMIKLIKRWWSKQKETEQLVRETSRAELQLLKAQVHPHFLFNTLNNIYFFILTNSKQGPEMIKKLSGMLQYILNECRQPMVPLRQEIEMVLDYMALEKIRYGQQLEMTIEIQDNFDDKKIAPLLLIPFVENSFKHGASKMIVQPWVRLAITVKNSWLHFSISNSRPETQESIPIRGNIGLKNVNKRLQLLYPSAYHVDITDHAESYAVNLKINLDKAYSHYEDIAELKPFADYEMA